MSLAVCTMQQAELDFTSAPSAKRRLGRDLGHAAAEAAARHADRVSPEWSDRALDMLRRYCEQHAEVMSEDVRQFAEGKGLAKPPEQRAWGNVMRRGKAAGFIEHAGWATAKDPRVHANPVGKWKSLIYGQGKTNGQ